MLAQDKELIDDKTRTGIILSMKLEKLPPLVKVCSIDSDLCYCNYLMSHRFDANEKLKMLHLTVIYDRSFSSETVLCLAFV